MLRFHVPGGHHASIYPRIASRLTHPHPEFEIHACVLAAGRSLRYGATKLVQEYRGKPLLQHALLSAQAVCTTKVTLVVGHDHENVVRAANNVQDRITVNKDYRDGIGSSIATATNAIPRTADAIIIMLGDQPLVTQHHLRDIVSAWSGENRLIVASSFEDIDCPPILFPRATFDLLKELRGDIGAKTVLHNDTFAVRRMPYLPAKFDIDTPRDLANLRSGNHE